jgi:predicted RNA-binding protein with PUA-like domain
MKHWLVKSEPESYSFDQLCADKKTAWTGVRNFTARNNLKAMKEGDEVFFYHSVTEKAIVGLAKVSRKAYRDPTIEADEKDLWLCVDLQAGKRFARPVTLEQIKKVASLQELVLLRQARLSVQPVGTPEAVILKRLGGL